MSDFDGDFKNLREQRRSALDAQAREMDGHKTNDPELMTIRCGDSRPYYYDDHGITVHLEMLAELLESDDPMLYHNKSGVHIKLTPEMLRHITVQELKNIKKHLDERVKSMGQTRQTRVYHAT